MRFGSVCSGIDAASVAWTPLGWRASFFSEIEAFPRAVLAHHYAEVPLHGDFTTIQAGDYEPIDLLVGGTPCQDFSVAGKRAGLDGARGNLTLQFADLAQRLGARWLVWENVPGVFSQNNGRDFGAVIACFAGHPAGAIIQPPDGGWRNFGIVGAAGPSGYGLAWRVLDAQWFGVPQRRRRVFLVGYLGDWRRAAAVLLERHSLSGHPAPRREAGQRTSPTIAGCSNGGGGNGPDRTADDADADALIPQMHAEVCPALKARDAKGVSSDGDGDGAILVPMVSHSLRADGFDASEDGTGRGTPLVPAAYLPFDTTQITSKANVSNPKAGDPCHPLAAHAHAHAPAIAFHGSQNPDVSGDVTHPLGRNQGQETCIAFSSKDHGADAGDTAPTLRAMGHDGSHANAGGQLAVAFDWQAGGGGNDHSFRGKSRSYIVRKPEEAGSVQANKVQAVFNYFGVRRLTPRECERLMGVDDEYTLVPYGHVKKSKLDGDFLKYLLRGNPKHLTRDDLDHLAADGPRYKSLGNSMVTTVMRWIGERIEMVEKIK